MKFERVFGYGEEKLTAAQIILTMASNHWWEGVQRSDVYAEYKDFIAETVMAVKEQEPRVENMDIAEVFTKTIQPLVARHFADEQDEKKKAKLVDRVSKMVAYSLGWRPNVWRDSPEAINMAGQTFCLRQDGTERADMKGWQLSEAESNRMMKMLEKFGLLGGITPASTKFDVIGILGAAQGTVEKRTRDLDEFLKSHPEVDWDACKILALGSNRKLWTFDAVGTEKEPAVFTLLARRYCEQNPKEDADEWTEKFRQEAKQFFQTHCQNGEGVKDISEKTSQYFKEHYGLSWPTESDMIEYVLSGYDNLNGKVVTLTSKDNPNGGRATTDQNAEVIRRHTTDGDNVLLVSNGKHGNRQRLVFETNLLGVNVNLEVLASREAEPSTPEEKQKLIEGGVDEFGRLVFTQWKLFTILLEPKVVSAQLENAEQGNTYVTPLDQVSEEQMKTIQERYGQMPKDAVGVKTIMHYDSYGTFMGQEMFFVNKDNKRILTTQEQKAVEASLYQQMAKIQK